MWVCGCVFLWVCARPYVRLRFVTYGVYLLNIFHYDTSWQLWLPGYILCSMCAIDVNTIFYPMFIFVLTLICFYCRMFIDLQLENGSKKKKQYKT